MKFIYIGNCTQLAGRDIQRMVDDAREIKYKTFLKYVGIDE